MFIIGINHAAYNTQYISCARIVNETEERRDLDPTDTKEYYVIRLYFSNTKRDGSVVAAVFNDFEHAKANFEALMLAYDHEDKCFDFTGRIFNEDDYFS